MDSMPDEAEVALILCLAGSVGVPKDITDAIRSWSGVGEGALRPFRVELPRACTSTRIGHGERAPVVPL